jgi:hypothetical protein
MYWAAFVDGVVPGESLTEMRVKPDLVAAGAASTEANRTQYYHGAFGHERESLAIMVVLGCLRQGLVVGWLKQNVTKTLWGEVGTQDAQLAIVESLNAGV